MKTIKPYLHKVNYYETDKMGITHHSNYIRYMEEARVDFLDQLGWSFIKLEEEGMASPVMSVEGVYKKSTTFPDTIEIMVGIEKLSAAKLATEAGIPMIIANGEDLNNIHRIMNGKPIGTLFLPK